MMAMVALERFIGKKYEEEFYWSIIEPVAFEAPA
jgi:hypothetical protein